MRARRCVGIFSHPAILLIPLAILLVHHHRMRWARASDRSYLSGPATMDGPLTVHGSLTIDGPATIQGVVKARRVIVNGPVSPVLAHNPAPGHNARQTESLEVWGPLTVNGPLNVDDTLTIRGPLTCESWSESGHGSAPHAAASPASQSAGNGGFNRLQHWLGLPLGQ